MDVSSNLGVVPSNLGWVLYVITKHNVSTSKKIGCKFGSIHKIDDAIICYVTEFITYVNDITNCAQNYQTLVQNYIKLMS